MKSLRGEIRLHRVEGRISFHRNRVLHGGSAAASLVNEVNVFVFCFAISYVNQIEKT